MPDERFCSLPVEDAMREAARLLAVPRGDASLDVVWQLSEVMPELHDLSGWRRAAMIADRALTWGALNQLSDEFWALPVVFSTIWFLLHLEHRLRTFPRGYKFLMLYNTHDIVQRWLPMFEYESTRARCASPPSVEHPDWDRYRFDHRESLEMEANSNVKILSHNPGHDGAIAFLQDGRLMMSIEAEKHSNARHSPVSIAEVFKAFGELDEIPDVICTGGWWPRDHYEYLHGSDVHAGYRGVTKNNVIVSKQGFLGKQARYFSSTHERSHILCAFGMSSLPKGRWWVSFGLLDSSGVGALSAGDPTESHHSGCALWKYLEVGGPNRKYPTTKRSTTCGIASDSEFNALTTTWKASQARTSQRAHLAPRSKKTPATIAIVPTSKIGTIQRSSGVFKRW
jgi:hypothetical protein